MQISSYNKMQNPAGSGSLRTGTARLLTGVLSALQPKIRLWKDAFRTVAGRRMSAHIDLQGDLSGEGGEDPSVHIGFSRRIRFSVGRIILAFSALWFWMRFRRLLRNLFG